jgi:hypothetical protein
MRGRLAHAVKVLLDLERRGKNLEVLADDVFIVSYPKSGNTWVRFLVGNLLDPERAVTFANLESRIPDIYTRRHRNLLRSPNPRYLKSHEPFDPRYRTVIYIVRDPRDIVLSYYNHQIKFGKVPGDFPFDEFTRRFVKGTVAPYGSWSEHVGSWLGARRGTEGFLTLRYEDLSVDPLNEVARVASFLKLDVKEGDVATAVQFSSIERLRELERKHANQWVSTSGTRTDMSFFRRGKVGAWQKELPQNLQRLIQVAWSDCMRTLGYME